MKLLLLSTPILILLISCSSNEGSTKLANIDSSKEIQKGPGAQMTSEFRDIDTTINLKLFSLSQYSRRVSRIEKKKLIIAAIKSVMGDADYRFLDIKCWKVNPDTRAIYEDTTSVAPDCRLDEFNLIDLDGDGDLDILYSSLVDQYAQWDRNFLLIIENNNNYRRFDISGYLYDADFSQIQKGKIIFKTVRRPCCDYLNYNFYTTSLDTKNWVFDTKHTLEIHESKVREIY